MPVENKTIKQLLDHLNRSPYVFRCYPIMVWAEKAGELEFTVSLSRKRANELNVVYDGKSSSFIWDGKTHMWARS